MSDLTRSGGSLYQGMKMIVAAAVVASFALTPSVAAAKSPVTMTVEAGYDGIYRFGSPIPVSVVIQSTRAISGTLEVRGSRVEGGRNLHRLKVELTGGGRKRFEIIVPSPPQTDAHLLVRLTDGKTLLARKEVPLATTEDVMVGVLAAEIPEALRSVDLVPTNKRPKVFRLTEPRVALGDSALAPLDYLVVAEGQERVSAALGGSITSWVLAGGRLIVVTPDPAAVTWMPDPWMTDPDFEARQGSVSVKRIGLGQAVLVRSSLQGATSDRILLQELLRPLSSERSRGFEGGASPEFELANALTRPKGRSLELDMFFVFLLAYLVLVGPVNYLLLKKRGRRELAWVTIPLVSMVFSGIAFGFARTNTDLQRVHHASIQLTSKDAGRANHLVALGAASRGDLTVSFDSPFGQTVSSFQGSGSRATRVTDLKGGQADVLVQTAPFSVSAVSGGGSAVKGYLDAQLRWDGHGLIGTVTNRTAYRMREVTLSTGIDKSTIGSLAPGASSEVVLVSSAGSDTTGQIVDGVNRQMMRFEQPFETSRTVGELMRSWFDGSIIKRGGGVFVTGVAEGVPTSAKVRGGPDGKTSTVALIASTAIVTVEQGAKTVGPVAGTWWLAGADVEQGWNHGGCPNGNCYGLGVLSLSGSKEATFGSRLPLGVDRSRLRNGRIAISTSNGPLDGDSGGQVVFRGGGAVPVPVPMPPDGAAGRTEAIVPPQAPDAAGSLRFQFWDWDKAAWVEGEFWPDGKDLVPPSAISSLGESFVRVISSNPSGFDIVAAGVDWEVS